jgi:hypothetical protein
MEKKTKNVGTPEVSKQFSAFLRCCLQIHRNTSVLIFNTILNYHLVKIVKIMEACLSVRPSVCLSVRLSVCLRKDEQTDRRKIKLSSSGRKDDKPICESGFLQKKRA